MSKIYKKKYPIVISTKGGFDLQTFPIQYAFTLSRIVCGQQCAMDYVLKYKTT